MTVVPAVFRYRGALFRLGAVTAFGLLIYGLAVQFSLTPVFVVILGYWLGLGHSFLYEEMEDYQPTSQVACPTCGTDLGGEAE